MTRWLRGGLGSTRAELARLQRLLQVPLRDTRRTERTRWGHKKAAEYDLGFWARCLLDGGPAFCGGEKADTEGVAVCPEMVGSYSDRPRSRYVAVATTSVAGGSYGTFSKTAGNCSP